MCKNNKIISDFDRAGYNIINSHTLNIYLTIIRFSVIFTELYTTDILHILYLSKFRNCYSQRHSLTLRMYFPYIGNSVLTE